MRLPRCSAAVCSIRVGTRGAEAVLCRWACCGHSAEARFSGSRHRATHSLLHLSPGTWQQTCHEWHLLLPYSQSSGAHPGCHVEPPGQQNSIEVSIFLCWARISQGQGLFSVDSFICRFLIGAWHSMSEILLITHQTLPYPFKDVSIYHGYVVPLQHHWSCF